MKFYFTAVTKKRLAAKYKLLWLLYNFLKVNPKWCVSVFVQIVMQKKIYTLTVDSYEIKLRRDSSDLEVFKEVFCDQQYAYVKKMVGEAETIVDLGSNIGLSIINLKILYPNARIIGVEPDQDNYNYCVQNTALFTDLFIEQKAIWYKSGSLELFNNEKGEYALSVVSSGAVRSLVSGITVNELFDKHNLGKVDLLKIDIEGAECDLFSTGETQWIEKVSCIIIELHDWIKPGCSEAFYRTISQYKFKEFHFLHNLIVIFDHENNITKPN